MHVTTKVKLSTLGYVIVYVQDTRESLKFYRDVLGLKVRSDDDKWVELETGEATLALHQDDKARAKRTGTQPHLVFNVEDIYGAYEALKAKGVAFGNAPATVCEAGDQIGKSADFKDPDGNPLSIFGMVPAKK